MIFNDSDQIVQYFLQKKLNEESMSYLTTHAKRFAFMLREIKEIKKKYSESSLTSLDIGPSFFTELYSIEFPEDRIYTLGYDHPESRGGHFPEDITYNKATHFYYNLNDTQVTGKLPENMPQFDLVIMAEVIEHLYTAPEIVLNCIKQVVKPGGFVIIQTPNAASFSKRTRLMFQGRNPYEMIRLDSHNPGHFREYTKKELINISNKLKFELYKIITTNYFKYDATKGSIQKFIRSLTYPGIMRYIFMVMKKI